MLVLSSQFLNDLKKVGLQAHVGTPNYKDIRNYRRIFSHAGIGSSYCICSLAILWLPIEVFFFKVEQVMQAASKGIEIALTKVGKQSGNEAQKNHLPVAKKNANSQVDGEKLCTLTVPIENMIVGDKGVRQNWKNHNFFKRLLATATLDAPLLSDEIEKK